MTGRIHAWLPGPLDAAATSAIDRLAATEDIHSVAIMPDAHLADEVCVGRGGPHQPVPRGDRR
jgi:tRNA-splicing ligase RtcB